MNRPTVGSSIHAPGVAWRFSTDGHGEGSQTLDRVPWCGRQAAIMRCPGALASRFDRSELSSCPVGTEKLLPHRLTSVVSAASRTLRVGKCSQSPEPVMANAATRIPRRAAEQGSRPSSRPDRYPVVNPSPAPTGSTTATGTACTWVRPSAVATCTPSHDCCGERRGTAFPSREHLLGDDVPGHARDQDEHREHG